MVRSYNKVCALGHRAVQHIFDGGPIEVTEKLDGSQFAFGIDHEGEVCYRSKGRQIPRHSTAENDLFYPVIEYVEFMFANNMIPQGYWFYGETLKSPRHSTLCYERIPRNHFALFGAVNTADTTDWSSHVELAALANEMQVDVVPKLDMDPSWVNPEGIVEFMQNPPESILGGVPMEGVVLKDYTQTMLFGPTEFPITTAKFVSEKFKEVHHRDWKAKNTGAGKWAEFRAQFRTEARWNKAIQHLREAGELQGAPQDIGPLLKEMARDILEEEREVIQAFLWKEFGKMVVHEAQRGFPEWYKEQLALGNVDAS